MEGSTTVIKIYYQSERDKLFKTVFICLIAMIIPLFTMALFLRNLRRNALPR